MDGQPCNANLRYIIYQTTRIQDTLSVLSDIEHHRKTFLIQLSYSNAGRATQKNV